MRRIAFVSLILLLFLTGSALAAAADNAEDEGYLLENSTTLSAGLGAVEDYELLAVIGEPFAGEMTNEEGYTLTSGFLSSPTTYLLRLPMVRTKP